MSPPSAVVASALAVLAAILGCSGEARQVERAQSDAQMTASPYLKLDFDDGTNPFTPTEPAQATLVAEPDQALSGRSLRVARIRDGRSVGAAVPLSVKGSSGLRVAFVTRAKSIGKRTRPTP